MTEKELMAYANEFGAESAASLLLLCPPDRFEGDYDRVLAMLEDAQERKVCYNVVCGGDIKEVT